MFRRKAEIFLSHQLVFSFLGCRRVCSFSIFGFSLCFPNLQYYLIFFRGCFLFSFFIFFLRIDVLSCNGWRERAPPNPSIYLTRQSRGCPPSRVPWSGVCRAILRTPDGSMDLAGLAFTGPLLLLLLRPRVAVRR